MEKESIEEILKDEKQGIGNALRILKYPHPGVHYRAIVGSMQNVECPEVVLPKEDYFLFKGSYAHFIKDPDNIHDTLISTEQQIEGLCEYDSDRIFILLREEKEE